MRINSEHPTAPVAPQYQCAVSAMSERSELF